MTWALEKMGDVLSKAATQAGKSARAKGEAERSEELPASPVPGRYDQPAIAVLPPQHQSNDIVNNLSKGCSSIVETMRS